MRSPKPETRNPQLAPLPRPPPLLNPVLEKAGREAMMTGMRRKIPWLYLGLAAVTLAGVVGVQLWDRTFHPAEAMRETPLAEAIAADLPGWRSEVLPLAETEQVESAALKKLNFSDYIYRAYRRGDLRVSVYIAYWEPLEMPVRQVGSHTPDVCWVLNGWECTEIRNRMVLPAGDGVLKEAEDRIFTYRGTREYVRFWHLINGKVYRADNKIGMWDRWNMLTDHFRFGLNQKPEQYFVRISSNRPFETFWKSPQFQTLLDEVATAIDLRVPAGDDPEEWSLEFAI